ncbi:MAG: 30S ribosomal protein S8 [Holosporales bacterium]|jgi:small subunit ribosomal protein S8|nr:30S ribosomal protein S8 [Holosporales bacterium]
MTDPISDMFARMRNAGMRGYKTVSVPASKLKVSILEALLREGYIGGYSKEIKDRFPSISIDLKYHDGKPVISSISKVSKPGCRIYANVKSIPQVSNGLGISIVSTSSGVFSDAEARERKLGGEVICKVF